MKSKLIFFDFDGTLSVKGKISEQNMSALEKAKAAGHKLFLNTGRSYGYCPERVKAFPFWDGLICGSTYVTLGNEVLLKKTMSEKTLAETLEFSREHNAPFILEGISESFVLIECNEYWKTHNVRMMTHEEARELLILKPEIQKMSLLRPETEIKGPEPDDYRRISLPDYQEYVHKGYGKDTGMRIIAERLGKTREDIVAFGDSENDREMLEYAGTAVIMHHAPDSLDDIADLRTDGDADGVCEGLWKLSLI